MEFVMFPIHLGAHWCLAVADIRDKSVKFYDSLLGQNSRCLQVSYFFLIICPSSIIYGLKIYTIYFYLLQTLLSYLSSEMKERKKTDLNRSEWKTEIMKSIPYQENQSDCGVFTCKFATVRRKYLRSLKTLEY